MPSKLPWSEIQEYYNDNHTQKECMEKFKFSGNAAWKATKRGEFKLRNPRERQIGRVSSIEPHILEKIADLYEQGYSWRDIIKLGFTTTQYIRSRDLGYLKPRSLKQAKKLCLEKYGPNQMGKEARTRLSKRQSEHNSGGKCKWFTVANKKVQGTWEKNLAEAFEELNITWERCKPWMYTINNETKRYTPDFYLPDYDLYIEVKGYWWGNDKEKMQVVMEQHQNKKIQLIEKELYKQLI